MTTAEIIRAFNHRESGQKSWLRRDSILGTIARLEHFGSPILPLRQDKLVVDSPSMGHYLVHLDDHMGMKGLTLIMQAPHQHPPAVARTLMPPFRKWPIKIIIIIIWCTWSNMGMTNLHLTKKAGTQTRTFRQSCPGPTLKVADIKLVWVTLVPNYIHTSLQ